MNAPVPVTVATVTQQTVPVTLHAIGSGEAFSTVSVKAMINGEITRVNFAEGQDVRKGQLLFSIDSRSYEAALELAQANLARDLAQQRNAQTEANRYASLYAQGVVAKEQSDQYETTAHSMDAAVQADRAAIDNAKVQLSYCSIYSPLDGRTGSLLIHQGNLVKANDTTSLVVINQITPMYVDFAAPEQYLAEIKKRMAGGRLRVEALIPKDQGGPEEGLLSFVDNAVDVTTGTIRLKGTFSNPRRRLWPGQFVDVVLTLGSQPNVAVVPSQSIMTTQNGQYVFVVKSDKTVESRAVTVGQALNGETVIEKGLQAGEVVVTDGQLRLVPGSKVEFKNALQSAEVKGS